MKVTLVNPDDGQALLTAENMEDELILQRLVEQGLYSLRSEEEIKTKVLTVYLRKFDQSAQMQEFRYAIAAFDALLPTLLQIYLGQFVVISGGKVIDSDRDELALATRVEKLHRSRFVLIEEVKPRGAERSVVIE